MEKDWEIWLALNDPNDPIHAHIEEQLEQESEIDEDDEEVEGK